eukprot:bmy_10570T0
MSEALDFLQMKEEDVLKFLAAGTHLGGTNLDFQMEQYIYKRKSDGVYNISLKRTWEKLLLAARAIVAIENPADVSVVSSRNTGHITPPPRTSTGNHNVRFSRCPREDQKWHKSPEGGECKLLWTVHALQLTTTAPGPEQAEPTSAPLPVSTSTRSFWISNAAVYPCSFFARWTIMNPGGAGPIAFRAPSSSHTLRCLPSQGPPSEMAAKGSCRRASALGQVSVVLLQPPRPGTVPPLEGRAQPRPCWPAKVPAAKLFQGSGYWSLVRRAAPREHTSTAPAIHPTKGAVVSQAPGPAIAPCSFHSQRHCPKNTSNHGVSITSNLLVGPVMGVNTALSPARAARHKRRREGTPGRSPPPPPGASREGLPPGPQRLVGAGGQVSPASPSGSLESGQRNEHGLPASGPSCRGFKEAFARVLRPGRLCSRRRPPAPLLPPQTQYAEYQRHGDVQSWCALERGVSRGSEGTRILDTGEEEGNASDRLLPLQLGGGRLPPALTARAGSAGRAGGGAGSETARGGTVLPARRDPRRATVLLRKGQCHPRPRSGEVFTLGGPIIGD